MSGSRPFAVSAICTLLIMNSLFWKIFVSFWLALLLFAGTSLWMTSRYLDDVRQEHNVADVHERLAMYTDEAREILRHEDAAALKAWLINLDRREAIPVLLVDLEGKDLLDRPVPARVARRMQRLNHELSEHEESHRYRHYSRRRHLIAGADGSVYRLIPDFQSITLGRVLKRPRVIAIPVLVATIIGGLVCLVLARYLTAPIGQLKRATERMASGEFSHRVAPKLKGRKDEIADLAEGFDYMAERVERLVDSHKQLLRDASHELRSPLARLQVALGLTRQRADASLDNELDRIERETERLNDLIGQLLSLARLESGGKKVSETDIDLDAMLSEIVDDARYEATANSKDVNLSIFDTGSIHGDEILLHSAIENIVRNAIRYTRENTEVDVSLSYNKDTSSYWITVCDHGPGVPEAMLPRLFEPFVRVGEARDRESGGYGLGLAIAERAVRLHNGSISAVNAAEGGVCMTIRLPARRQSA
jgi:two-component system sensor histidine kinase CpxA